MKFFLDTANIKEISISHEWGVIDGVTTNPSLIAQENREFHEIIHDIVNIVNGPVSAEVIGLQSEEMIREAKEMAEWSKHVVIKIPMTPEGLKAVKKLSAINIKTNVTLVFSVNQAIMAAKAGATYVSPFIGRLDDIGQDGMQIVRDMVQIFKIYQIDTEIIVASVRHPLHVIEAAKTGAQVATIPFNVIEKMFLHPLTEIGLNKFLKDWEKVTQSKLS